MKTVDDIITGALGDDQAGEKVRYAKGIGIDHANAQDDQMDGVKLLTVEGARKAMRKDFFDDPKISTLPEELHTQVVDYAIESGIGRAVITLQEVLEKIRHVRPDVGYGHIDADGVIGAVTRRAAAAAVALLGGDEVNNQIAAAREGYLRRAMAGRVKVSDDQIARCRSFRTDIG